MTTSTNRKKRNQFNKNVMSRTSEVTTDLLRDWNEGVEFYPRNFDTFGDKKNINHVRFCYRQINLFLLLRIWL